MKVIKLVIFVVNVLLNIKNLKASNSRHSILIFYILDQISTVILGIDLKYRYKNLLLISRNQHHIIKISTKNTCSKVSQYQI